MSTNNSFILAIGLIIWVFCHTAWVFLGYDTYYIGTAFIIFISSYIINNITKNKCYHKFITRLFLFLAFNNLVDEIFFDPKVFDWNEYLVFILYIIYSGIRCWSTTKT
jgi:hypothetical protein